MDPMSLDSLISIDAQLSDDERAARDTVRSWVSDRFSPVVTEHHRQGTFPEELIPEIADLGLFGANLPEEYGCAGMNAVSYGLIMQELERGDSGLRSLASVQGSLVMWPIFAFGSEDQKKKYLPQLAGGKMIGCFGLTEPGSGSDPGSMTTTAVRDGDHYVLNGVKTWITNSPISQLAVVWAKCTDENDAIRGFIVEREFKGYETPYIDGKFSLRASPTGEIHLNDCRVPASNMMPEVKGLKGPLSCLTQARHGIGWGVTGAAMDCFEVVRAYGLERKQF
ncbi:MAG: acyl-CoA dehydrogenase family protein, partial [Myxococcota bacterium]